MIYEAIKEVYPNAVTIYNGETAFDKDGKEIVLDESKLAIVVARLQSEYDAQEYARKRQAEYPTIAELTVALYDTDDKADIEAKRVAVKNKYPKPE